MTPSLQGREAGLLDGGGLGPASPWLKPNGERKSGDQGHHSPAASHSVYLEQELMDGGKRSFTLWELGPKPLHRTRVIGSFHFIVSFFFFSFKFNPKVIFC